LYILFRFTGLKNPFSAKFILKSFIEHPVNVKSSSVDGNRCLVARLCVGQPLVTLSVLLSIEHIRCITTFNIVIGQCRERLRVDTLRGAI